MFILFGWGHTKIKDCGPVQEEECVNCHNKDIWQLKKISKFFTLFFIPIFPYDSDSIYHCPICNYGVKLDNEQFKSYNEIAQINVDCLNNVITEEQREIKLKQVNQIINERVKSELGQNKENSSKWAEMVAQKSTEELQKILSLNKSEYNPAFIIAVENELSKRQSS